MNTDRQRDFLAEALWEDEDRRMQLNHYTCSHKLDILLCDFGLQGYWTSARESRNNPQFFAWDTSGSVIEDIYRYVVDATGGPDFTPYTICGMLELKYEYPPHVWMVAKPCKNPHFTLCMIRSYKLQ